MVCVERLHIAGHWIQLIQLDSAPWHSQPVFAEVDRGDEKGIYSQLLTGT